jgi:hypothetical protein
VDIIRHGHTLSPYWHSVRVPPSLHNIPRTVEPLMTTMMMGGHRGRVDVVNWTSLHRDMLSLGEVITTADATTTTTMTMTTTGHHEYEDA